MAEKIILELKDKDFDIKIVESNQVKNTQNISNELCDSIKETLINM
jgi:hypothetical protein